MAKKSYALVDHSDALSTLLQWMERRRRDFEQALQKELYFLKRQWNAFVLPIDDYSLMTSVLPGGTDTTLMGVFTEPREAVRILRTALTRVYYASGYSFSGYYAPGY